MPGIRSQPPGSGWYRLSDTMASNNQEPPAITLTTTTSAPVTQTYTINGRRSRNTDAPINTTYNTRPASRPPSTPKNETLEPFPTMTPGLSQQRTNEDYFPPTPLEYQVRTRPIGIRRLPSSNQVQQQSNRPRSGSGLGLTRRRTNTGPRREEHIESNATAGLAGLPGHYEVGQPGAGMDTIQEGQVAQHGEPRNSVESTENRVGRSGSTRLRRASNAARSVLSKLSDDPDEDGLRRNRAGTGNGRDYESDVVDYLDVLGKVSPRTTREMTDLFQTRKYRL